MSAGMPGPQPSGDGKVVEYDSESPSLAKLPGPWPASNDGHSYNSRANMGSWARRTSFKGMERGASNGSDIEINLSDVTHIPKNSQIDSAEHSPVVRSHESRVATNGIRNGLHANGTKEITEKNEVVPLKAAAGAPPGPFNLAKTRDMDSDVSRNSSGQLRIEPLRIFKDPDVDAMSQSEDSDDRFVISKHLHMEYELRETPGLGKHSRLVNELVSLSMIERIEKSFQLRRNTRRPQRIPCASRRQINHIIPAMEFGGIYCCGKNL